jgi:hypothetical protein
MEYEPLQQRKSDFCRPFSDIERCRIEVHLIQQRLDLAEARADVPIKASLLLPSDGDGGRVAGRERHLR